MRYCSAKSYGVMDASDLASETILRALESFDKLNNEEAFLSFLFSIANNIIKNELRREKFKAPFSKKNTSTVLSQEINAETRLDIKILYNALNQLTEKQKEALILFEVSGFKIKEIMKIQTSTEPAVKQRLKRGRENLAKILGVKELQNKTLDSKSTMLTSIFL